jgi:hypothetical protein
MNDRLTRTLATVAISLALVAVILSGYALYLQSRSIDQLEALSESITRAIEARPAARDRPLLGPPPALDDGVD